MTSNRLSPSSHGLPCTAARPAAQPISLLIVSPVSSGRAVESPMGAPRLPDPAAASSSHLLGISTVCSCHQSRPGAGVGVGGGVSQPAPFGKYQLSVSNTSPDACSVFRPIVTSSAHPTSSATLGTSAVAVTSSLQQPMSAPERGFLNVYYQNVRGLRTKTNTLLLALGSCDYDVIIFTETWLTPGIKDCEFAAGYDIFRCDRNAETSSLQRGGGVLVAVKSGRNCKEVELVSCESLEQVAVRISLPHQSLFVCCIYVGRQAASICTLCIRGPCSKFLA